MSAVVTLKLVPSHKYSMLHWLLGQCHRVFAGLIVTLFVSGFLPFSAVVFGLVFLLSLATACRAYILHQYAQQLRLAPVRLMSCLLPVLLPVPILMLLPF